jgi:hypothetical protein
VDERSVEVDTAADLQRAQNYFKGLKGSHGRSKN